METIIDLSGNSLVWIYQSDRIFSEDEVIGIKNKLSDFVTSWVSHNRMLKSHGDILHRRFIALFVDETQSGASGCSIDASVHFVTRLGLEYKADFFNRMIFSYIKDNEVCTADAAEFKELYAKGVIDDLTMVFDNLVKTKNEFVNSWKKPLGESWLKRFV